MSKVDNIFTTSRYLNVSVPSNSISANYSGALGVGDIRFNPNSQQTEVYDGNSWMPHGYEVLIEMSAEAEQLLDWAREQQTKQLTQAKLAKKYPSLQAALDQLETVQILVQSHEENSEDTQQ